ncbi:3-ketoacyl-CoA thiolase, partial [Natronomonas gomsonensis]|nr:3-ketoacyl-CoA thiolase [Natronomonas gomsonensis]
MSRANLIAVGSSPLGETDLPGRDLFSKALAEAFEELPDPADVVDGLYVGAQSERYENQIMQGTLMAEWA